MFFTKICRKTALSHTAALNTFSFYLFSFLAFYNSNVIMSLWHMARTFFLSLNYLSYWKNYFIFDWCLFFIINKTPNVCVLFWNISIWRCDLFFLRNIWRCEQIFKPAVYVRFCSNKRKLLWFSLEKCNYGVFSFFFLAIT